MNRSSSGGKHEQEQINSINQQHLKKIIGGDSPDAIELLIEEADRLGKALQKDLTTSQIRNIFGEVRSIEQEVRVGTEKLPLSVQRRLLMLKPKMAYQVGRFTNNRGLKALVETLSTAIDLVGDDVGRFHTFVDLFEAILAYHRFYGGRAN
ncbi:type III-A CRISPR-associated protein Csm2 [Chloroflexus sp.]|uniref:type III-A CRISPR-associated protein Csm2 n=1 Tax=Chloroflexus sp. TaxID=1904827 RepID=UPI002ACE96A7|nr:type III-A CRISPR-associated protein Csm2 [Chloroflexus sp.]